MIDTINIRVDSWIIQDGNYEDFATGDRRRLAFEFYAAKPLRPTTEGAPGLAIRDGERYDIIGKVVFVHPGAWVIDCGVLAYREESPPVIRVNSMVRGLVMLGIDPFFYKESLRKLPGMPNLYYDVEITALHRETTPWITRLGVTQRRPGRRTFAEIAKTNAWKDDDGSATYILNLRLLG